MKTHKSYLKLEVSHKPNIFFGTYEQRLIDWKNIRSIINEEQNPLEILSKIYFYCPRTKTKTDLCLSSKAHKFACELSVSRKR